MSEVQEVQIKRKTPSPTEICLLSVAVLAAHFIEQSAGKHLRVSRIVAQASRKSLHAATLFALTERFGKLFEEHRLSIFFRGIKLLHEYGDQILRTVYERIELRNEFETELFGQMYEASLRSISSKKTGTFYTPQGIVRRMTTACIAPRMDSGPLPLRSVCDPSCGAGYFLIAALRVLLEKPQILHHALEGDDPILCGVDLDHDAISLCELCLRVELLKQSDIFWHEPEVAERIVRLHVGNSLIDPKMLPKEYRANDVSPFSWEQSFSEAVSRGGFDCIIGNPPYGLARGQQLSAVENDILKSRYSEFRTGKVNKYLLFMARGDQLLHQSGTMSLIVPNAWLGLRAGRPLRERWLREQCLKHITYFSYKVFPKISVEPVVFLLDRSHRHSFLTIQKISESETLLKERNIPTCALNAFPEKRIPLSWTHRTIDILEHIRKNSIPLGSRDSSFVPYIALQAYATGKGTPPQSQQDVKDHVFHCNQKTSDDCYPYLQGGDIRPFAAHWSGQYLRYGAFLAEPQNLERFTGARVAVREVLANVPYLLSSCYLSEVSLYNKSVLNIVCKDKNGETLAKTLSCILNSKLSSFVILATGRKSQRRIFPKIVADDLKEFPVCKNFEKYSSRLATLYDQMSAFGGTDCADARILRSEIDTLVFTMYGVGEASLPIIEDMIP